MPISIDWGTSVISVPQSYLTHEGGSIYTLNTNQFRLDLKDEEDSLQGMPFLKTHNHNPPFDVGGVTIARTVEILDPYTITFEDGQYRVILEGSNNNILEKTNVNQVSVSSTNSAGLVTSDGIEALEYERGVFIDVTSSYTGYVYPTGTMRQPVNNIPDAKTICSLRGFGRLYIIGNITLDSGDDIENMEVFGESARKTTITVNSGALTADAEFANCTITGVFDDSADFYECALQDIQFVKADIYKCVLAGTITLSGSGESRMIHCWSGVAGTGTPTINMGGSGRGLMMRQYSGGIELTNKSGTEAITLDFVSGHAKLTSSVTAGTIVIRGNCKVTDESVGATVIDEHTLENVVNYLTRAIGLVQENQYIDQQSYVDGRLTSARLRIYSDPASVGTDSDVVATYTITATYSGTNLETYKVVQS